MLQVGVVLLVLSWCSFTGAQVGVVLLVLQVGVVLLVLSWCSFTGTTSWCSSTSAKLA